MKKDTHPKYDTEAAVTCVCGNSFTTGSTISEIKTELCSKCHPFFTGKQKLVDSAQRVEKFKKKLKAGASSVDIKKAKTAKTEKRAEAKTKARAKKEVKNIASK
jgi:large subunit ribosomal protein L31